MWTTLLDFHPFLIQQVMNLGDVLFDQEGIST